MLLASEGEISLKENIRKTIKNLHKGGFFAIYFSTILTKVVVLLGGIFIVRFLSIEDYAIYTLINNAFSMLTILGDFGVSAALLLFLIENNGNEKKYNSYLKFGIKYGLISSLISAFVIFLSPAFYPYRTKVVERYTLILVFIPMITAGINIISSILRAKKDNKRYSIYQIINVICHYSIIIPMCILLGVLGSIVSQYIYMLLTFIIGLFLVKKYFGKTEGKADNLSKKEKKGFIRYAVSSQTANLTSTLLYSIDIFVIGQMVVNTRDLSIYKVATIIPNALSFLPSCLMIYLLPYYVNHNKDNQWIKENTKKLFKYGFLGYFVISLLLIACSKYIFLILYGKKYIDAMYAFMILIIGFLFNSTFKVPIGNIISALKYPIYNTIVNIICLACNLIFNYLFIKIFGYIGAAITTTTITILSSALYLIILKKVLKKNEKTCIVNK